MLTPVDPSPSNNRTRACREGGEKSERFKRAASKTEATFFARDCMMVCRAMSWNGKHHAEREEEHHAGKPNQRNRSINERERNIFDTIFVHPRLISRNKNVRTKSRKNQFRSRRNFQRQNTSRRTRRIVLRRRPQDGR